MSETYAVELSFNHWMHVFTALEMYQSRSEELDCIGQANKTEAIQKAIETQLKND